MEYVLILISILCLVFDYCTGQKICTKADFEIVGGIINSVRNSAIGCTHMHFMNERQITDVKENVFANSPILDTVIVMNFSKSGVGNLTANKFNLFNNIEIADFSGCGVFDMKAVTFENSRNSVREAYFGGSKFRRVPDPTLLNYPGLKVWSYPDSGADMFDPDAFSNCLSLEELDLSGNVFTQISDADLDHLGVLKKLYLGRINTLETISPQAFARLLDLQYLEISGTRIASIGDVIFNKLTKLTTLVLNDNALLKTISLDAFVNNNELKEIHLNNVQLTNWCDPNNVAALQKFTIISDYDMYEQCCSQPSLCTTPSNQCNINGNTMIRRCSTCNNGYKANSDGICENIIDCVIGTCFGLCTEDPGGPAQCEACPAGYAGDGKGVNGCMLANCPENSTRQGVVPECECNPDYIGTIQAIAGAPYYSGSCSLCPAGSQPDAQQTSCTPVDCPANSEGIDLVQTCICAEGYKGIIQAIAAAPYYTGSCSLCPPGLKSDAQNPSNCTPVDCPANSEGINIVQGCTCTADYQGTIQAISGAPYYSGTCVHQCDINSFKVDQAGVLHQDKDHVLECEVLALANASLQGLATDVFKGFKRLVRIDLQYNNITYLQMGFFDSLIENNVEILLDKKTKCSSYAFFLDSDSRLQRKTGDNFVFTTECQYLNLSSSEIRLLADGIFDDFNQLTFLDLTKNDISYLQPDIFDDIGLTLNEDLLLDLKTKCTGYSFTTENGILKMKEPRKVYGLTNCIKIDLNSYGIRQIENGLFDELSILTELNLNQNELKTLESFTNSFSKTDSNNNNNNNHNSITILKLANNSITNNLTSSSFNQFTKLQSIYLNNNKIENMNGTCFSTNTYLSTIYLHDNMIKKLEHGIFSSMNQLSILHIENNPLDCCASAEEMTKLELSKSVEMTSECSENLESWRSQCDLSGAIQDDFQENLPLPLIIGLSAGGFFVVLLMVVGIIYFTKYRGKKSYMGDLNGLSAEQFVMGTALLGESEYSSSMNGDLHMNGDYYDKVDMYENTDNIEMHEIVNNDDYENYDNFENGDYFEQDSHFDDIHYSNESEEIMAGKQYQDLFVQDFNSGKNISMSLAYDSMKTTFRNDPESESEPNLANKYKEYTCNGFRVIARNSNIALEEEYLNTSNDE